MQEPLPSSQCEASPGMAATSRCPMSCNDDSPSRGVSRLPMAALDFSPWGLDNRIPLRPLSQAQISTSGQQQPPGVFLRHFWYGLLPTALRFRADGRAPFHPIMAHCPTAPFSASTINWTTFNSTSPLRHTGTNGTRKRIRSLFVAWYDAGSAAQCRGCNHSITPSPQSRPMLGF